MKQKHKILISLVKFKGNCTKIKYLDCYNEKCPIYASNPVTKHRLGCGLSDNNIYERSIMLLTTDGITFDKIFDEVL